MKLLNALFTYGSLQLGKESDHYLKKLTGIWKNAYVFGNYITTGKASAIGYPVIKLDPKGAKITGMLFQSNQLMSVINTIDAYEGDCYQRVVTDVYLNDGSKKKAFIYELNTDE